MSTAATSRTKPDEILLCVAISLSLVVGYLNSQSQFATIASRPVKLAALILCLVAALNVIRTRGLGGPYRLNRPTVLAILVLFSSIAGASLWNSAESDEWVLLWQAAAQLAFIGLLTSYQPRLSIASVLSAATAHCALAILGGTVATSDDFFEARASGGSHPILVGFAALVALALSWTYQSYALRLALSVVALYAMYLSFSRTAILGFLIALVLLYLLHRDSFLIPRVLLAAALVVSGISSFVAILIEVLAQGDLESLYTASGRSEIWSRLWSVRDVFLPFGIGLGDSTSAAPKWHVVEVATLGQPAENSFLQSALYGGIPAVVALLALLGWGSVQIWRSYGAGWTCFALVTAFWTAALATSGLAGFGFQFIALSTVALASNLDREVLGEVRVQSSVIEVQAT